MTQGRKQSTNPCYRDIFRYEKRGQLEEIGVCTIGLCYRPGIIAFGVWVMCKEHADEYLQLRAKWGVQRANKD